jgi:GntR family transcriptional regulator/MocR family aminotransferase
MKALLDDLSPTLEQLALAHLLGRGHYQRHIRRSRGIYRARRDRLAVALAEHFPGRGVFGVAAGLSVVLDLPSRSDDRELERIASQAGVRVEALTRYAIQDRGSRGLVIGYGRVHESAIGPALAALAGAIVPELGTRRRRP